MAILGGDCGPMMGLSDAEYRRREESSRQERIREEARRAKMTPAQRKKEDRQRFWGHVGAFVAGTIGGAALAAVGLVGIGVVLMAGEIIVKFVAATFL